VRLIDSNDLPHARCRILKEYTKTDIEQYTSGILVHEWTGQIYDSDAAFWESKAIIVPLHVEERLEEFNPLFQRLALERHHINFIQEALELGEVETIRMRCHLPQNLGDVGNVQRRTGGLVHRHEGQHGPNI